MRWRNCIVLGLLAWLGVGCSIKRIHDDPRYFGGFRTDIEYATQVETIITKDKTSWFYSSLLITPDRLALVAAGSGGATNYTQGKFTKLKQWPVSEIDRLPAGTRVKFIGVDVIWDLFEPPRSVLPYVEVIGGPHRGEQFCVYYLCSDEFFRWWLGAKRQMATVKKGWEVEVFSPSERFLLPVEQSR
jgi:hypothetical protein